MDFYYFATEALMTTVGIRDTAAHIEPTDTFSASISFFKNVLAQTLLPVL